MLAASFLGLAVAGVLLSTGTGHAVMGLGLPMILHLVIAFGGVRGIIRHPADCRGTEIEDGRRCRGGRHAI